MAVAAAEAAAAICLAVSLSAERAHFVIEVLVQPLLELLVGLVDLRDRGGALLELAGVQVPLHVLGDASCRCDAGGTLFLLIDHFHLHQLRWPRAAGGGTGSPAR